MSPAAAPVRARSARRLAAALLVIAVVPLTVAVGGPAHAAATTNAAATPKVCSDATAFDNATKALSGLERGDLAGAAEAVHEATVLFVDGSKRAPAAIAADWKLMAKALTDLDGSLAKAAKATGDAVNQAVTDLIATVQRLDADPTLIDASERLQAWIADKCNAVLTAVDAATTTTSTVAKGKAATTRKATTTTRRATTTAKATTTRKGATTRKGKTAVVTTTGKTTKKK